MALTFAELESITNDYFLADGKKAVDIYFNTSFLLNYLLKQKKGMWERPEGGEKIRVPLEYDGQESGFYKRGETISSDDRESVNAAFFEWKHAFGNATIYRIDELKNSGRYAEVQLTVQRVGGAQKSITKTLADSIFDDAVGAGSARLGGLLACMNETATTKYGDIAENDLVAQDGQKPWEGKRTTTTEGFGMNVIRTMATDAKIRDGKNGKPNLVVTTEALWNILSDTLSVQQRYVNSEATAKAGFSGLHIEGKDIFPDDYCPSGTALAINTAHYGFAVHKMGNFMRTKWKVIPDSPEDRSMKIFFDGNTICDNRKGHIAHTNLS
jgi:hypothetical protein